MTYKINKPGYKEYMEYLQSLDWKLYRTTITEKSEYVTVHNGDIGITSAIVDLRCPAGKKMSIAGSCQFDDGLSPHSLQVRFGDGRNEISGQTKIRITKESN